MGGIFGLRSQTTARAKFGSTSIGRNDLANTDSAIPTRIDHRIQKQYLSTTALEATSQGVGCTWATAAEQPIKQGLRHDKRGGIGLDTHQRKQHNNGAVQTKRYSEILQSEARDERDSLDKKHQYER